MQNQTNEQSLDTAGQSDDVNTDTTLAAADLGSTIESPSDAGQSDDAPADQEPQATVGEPAAE